MSIDHVRVIRKRHRHHPRTRQPTVGAKAWRSELQTLSDQFNASFDRRPGSDIDRAHAGPAPRVENVTVSYRTASDQQRVMMRQRRKRRAQPGLSARAATRATATGATTWINAWALFLYVTVQLPFAIASTMAFGIAAFIYSSIATLRQETDGVAGFMVQAGIRGLEAIAGFLSSTLYEVVLQIASVVFGLSFDPMILFLIGYALIFAFGLMQLLLSWFVYSLAGVPSLSGDAASAKIGLFILAAVGICIPILNLFPLVLIWTTLVWLRPR